LPELRRHATRPDAIVLTSKSLHDISALKTLLETYPGTPVYSTLPLPDLPWDIRYCPTHNLAGITFEKSRDGCSARFAGQTL
jgi:hypothetical protein